MKTEPFTKLFSSVLDSTLWVGTSAALKLVWITILAKKNLDGEVGLSVAGLAKIAEVSVDEARESLGILLGPDPDSRTKEYLPDGTLHPLSGRRLEEIDGGWRVINNDKYRALMSSELRREYQRSKQASYRAKKR